MSKADDMVDCAMGDAAGVTSVSTNNVAGALLPNSRLCGWLAKQTVHGVVKFFRNRWFVYSNKTGKLYFYRSPHDLLPLGEIDIRSASFGVNSDVPKSTIFKICVGGRTHVLDAFEWQSMLQWMTQLQTKRREFNQQRTCTSLAHDKASSEKPKDVLLSSVPSDTEQPTAVWFTASPSASDDQAELSMTDPSSEPSVELRLVPPYNSANANKSSRGSERTSESLEHLLDDWHLVNADKDAITPEGYLKQSSSSGFLSRLRHMSSSLSMTFTDTDSDSQAGTFGLTKTLSVLRQRLGRKSTGDDGATFISGLTADSTGSSCSKCRQLEDTIAGLREDLQAVEDELDVTHEVTKLLQREFDKLSRQKEAINRARDESTADNDAPIESTEEKQESKIVDLEFLLRKTVDEKNEVGNRLKTVEVENTHNREQVTMLEDMLKAKDEVIMRLSDEISRLENKHGDEFSSVCNAVVIKAAEAEVASNNLRLLSNEVENMKDECRAYQFQNRILSKEILELNQLREDDSTRVNSMIIQHANLDARYCQTRSKYLYLLNELKTPVRGDEADHRQEVVDQLLQDAIENEEQGSDDFISSSNSTHEHDHYGFTKENNGWSNDEERLNNRAAALQTRSDKLLQQLKDSDQTVSHKVRWENFMVNQQSRPLQRCPELKALIRGGVPHEYREMVWKMCINSHVGRDRDKLGPHHYKTLVSRIATSRQNPNSKQVELDLLRTLPDNQYFDSLESDGVKRLRRVLLAYTWHNSEIGYCQGLNRLAAIALLFLSEEESFWCLVAIVEHIMPPEYYSKSLEGSQVDLRVMRDLLQDKLPRLHMHLDRLELDFSLFLFNWFLTVFVDSCQPDTFLRVWDSLLYEGSKVLFRFGLALLKIEEEQLLKQDTVTGLSECLRTIGERVTDMTRLAQIAFGDLNPFPMKVIRTRRQFYLTQIKAELVELENIRRTFHSQKVVVDRQEFYSDEDDA